MCNEVVHALNAEQIFTIRIIERRLRELGFTGDADLIQLVFPALFNPRPDGEQAAQ